MLFVVGGVDILLGDAVSLGSEHVKLGVPEGLLGVLHLSHSLLDRLLLVGLFAEHRGFQGELPLQLSRLGVEAVVVCHLLAEVSVFPEAQRARTDERSALEHSHLLVESGLRSDVGEADLPELEADGDSEERPDAA